MDTLQTALSALHQTHSPDQMLAALAVLFHRIITTTKLPHNIQTIVSSLKDILTKRQAELNLEELLFYFNGEMNEQLKFTKMSVRTRHVVITILQTILGHDIVSTYVLTTLIQPDLAHSCGLLNQLFMAQSIFINHRVDVSYQQIQQVVIDTLVSHIHSQSQGQSLLGWVVDKVVMSGYIHQYVNHLCLQYSSSHLWTIHLQVINKSVRKQKIIYSLFNQASTLCPALIPGVLQIMDHAQLLAYILHNDLKSFFTLSPLTQYLSSLDHSTTQQLLQSLIHHWGQPDMIHHQNYKQQIYVTNLIVALTTLPAHSHPEILNNNLHWISQGITTRLAYENEQQHNYTRSFKEEKEQDYDLQKKMGYIMAHAAQFTQEEYEHTIDKQEQEKEQEKEQEEEEEEEEEEQQQKEEFGLLDEDRVLCQFYRPRHLYDVLLGLQQTDSHLRFMTCLKYIPTIINQKLPENTLYLGQVTQTLLTMNPHLHMMVGQNDTEEQILTIRQQALSSCIMADLSLYQQIICRWSSDICSLADRYMLIDVIILLAQQLSNDKIQAHQQQQDTLTENDFFFRKGKTLFYRPEEQKRLQAHRNRQYRLEQKTKRSKCISRSELSNIYIPKQSSTTNTLNQVLPGILLPLINLLRAPSDKLADGCIATRPYLMTNISLLQQLLSTLSTIIRLARNSIYLFQCLSTLVPMLSELVVQLSNSAFLRSVTFLFYQITNCLSLDMMLSYHDLAHNLLEFVRHQEQAYSHMDQPTRVLMTTAVKSLMTSLSPPLMTNLSPP